MLSSAARIVSSVSIAVALVVAPSAAHGADETPAPSPEQQAAAQAVLDKQKEQAAAQAAAARQAAAVSAGVSGALNLAADAAATSSNRALQVTGITLGNAAKAVSAGAKSGVAAGIVTFGFDELTSLLFPKPSTSTEIHDLSVQMAADFDDVQADIEEVQQQLTSVGTTAKQAVALAADANCSIALAAADAKVSTIKSVLMTYQDVFDSNWWRSNLQGKAPQTAQQTVFNKVFATAEDFSAFQTAVSSLAAGLSTSGMGNSNSLIASCADEAAAAALANTTNGPGTPVAIGELESLYFPVLQGTIAEYAGFAAVGQVVASAMGQIQMGSRVGQGSVPAPCGETPDSGEANDANTCLNLSATHSKTADSIQAAFRAVGASWSQVSGDAIASDLYGDNTSSTFQNGMNAWVRDIAQYGAADLSSDPGSALTSLQAAGTGPASGTTALSDPTWGGLRFAPATSKDWNSLLRTQWASWPGGPSVTPGTTANNQCLPSASGSLPSGGSGKCEASMTTGQLMATAGLKNGGQPVGDYLIVYTGETDTWSLDNGAWYFGVPIQWDGDKFPSGRSITALSFLDSSFPPNNGASVVIHDPAQDQGTITTSSLFPLALYNQTGQKNGVYLTSWELTDTMSSSPNGTYYGQVACSDGTGNSDWWLDVSFPQSSWTMDRLNLGGDLYCGAFKYAAGSDSNISLTPNNTFYASPSINLIGYDAYENFGGDVTLQDTYDSGVYWCNSTFASGGIDSGSCPPDWASAPGYFSGRTTQEQYLWPVIGLPSPTSVAPTDPDWVVFNQGSAGNLNVPAVNRQLFQDYLAMRTGIDSGPISVFVPDGVANKGGDAAQMLITNTSGASQTVVVTIDAGSARITDAPYDTTGALGKGISDLTCSKNDATQYSCVFTAPNGTSVLGIPVSLTGATNSSGEATGTLVVSGNGGRVGSDLGGKAYGSFGGVFALNTSPSQVSEDVAQALGAADAGRVSNVRATLIDTPASQVGKVQDTTGLKAGPYGVQLSLAYRPGSAGYQNVKFKVTGTLNKGSEQSTVVQEPCGNCNLVSGTVGATSNKKADVTLSITSMDKSPSTISVREGGTVLWSSDSTVRQGETVTAKLKGVSQGDHTYDVVSSNLRGSVDVTVAPGNGSVALTAWRGATSNSTQSFPLYLPEDGNWTFEVAPELTTVKQVAPPDITSADLQNVTCKGELSNDWCSSALTMTVNKSSDTATVTVAAIPEDVYTPFETAPKVSVSVDGRPFASASNVRGRYDLKLDPLADGKTQINFQYRWTTAQVAPGYYLTESVSATVTADVDSNLKKTYTYGQSDSVTVTVGPEKAPEPAKLMAHSDPATGLVTVSWRPVVVVPPVLNYELVATPPAGDAQRVVLDASATEATFLPDQLGPWQVELTAVNELGDGPAAEATLMVNSAVPPAPTEADLSVSPAGVLSAGWTSVASRPETTSYQMALFDPNGSRVYSDEIRVTPYNDTTRMRMPEFYALGRNSSPGQWTFVVRARNSDGTGATTRATVMLSPYAIARMERLAQEERLVVEGIAATLIGVDRAECAAGLVSGAMATGSCTNGIFVPSAGLAGMLDDPGAKVTHVSCAGDAASKAVTNCDPVTGVIRGGTATLLITQRFGGDAGSRIAVWFADQKLWQSPDRVPNGQTVTASIPAPPGSYSARVVTQDDAGTGSGIISVIDVVVPRIPVTNVSPVTSGTPAAVTVTGCKGTPPCPTVSGTVADGNATLTITAPSLEPSSMNIVDSSTGAMPWDTAGAPVAPGQTVKAVLTGLSSGQHTYTLYNRWNRTSFVVRVP